MALQISDQRLINRIDRLARLERRSPEEIVSAALDAYLHRPGKTPGVDFLLSIAGQGQSSETEVSARDEEILAAEVDPVKGWRVDDKPNSA
jgi:predicted transcriptional regulator